MNISIEQLKTLNSDQLIELHNAYCEDSDDYNNIIRDRDYMMESLEGEWIIEDAEAFINTYSELSTKSVFGYKFDGYGHLQGVNVLEGNIFLLDIQRWLESDPILNLSDELKDILVEFAEEDED